MLWEINSIVEVAMVHVIVVTWALAVPRASADISGKSQVSMLYVTYVTHPLVISFEVCIT